MANVFVSDEMKKNEEKDPEYRVSIKKYDNSVENVKDVIDVVFNDSILSVVTYKEIRYYKIKHLREWHVRKW